MFGILVVSHEDLAEQFVITARKIVGEKLEHLNSVSIGWEQDLSRSRDSVEKALEEVAIDGKVIILTDMFGGTPANVSLTFLEDKKVEVLTGVNLPMLIKLVQHQLQNDDISEAAKAARKRGRDSILLASDVLNGEE